MSRHNEIQNAYRSLGKDVTFYDSMITCSTLPGRVIAARKYPDLFPDRDAERIVRELGEDISGKALCRLQYMWMNCLIRQYNLAWEITEYLKNHPKAAVVELGAGLSCLRRQMDNETNSWYCLDMADVIALRETHIPKGAREKNIIRADCLLLQAVQGSH